MADGTQSEFYGYQEDLMHGHYQASYSDYAKNYAKLLKYQTVNDDIATDFEQEQSMRSYSQPQSQNCCWKLSYHWRKIRALLANDYSFLLILGILMAFISFGVDYVIEKIQMAHILLYRMVEFNSFLQYMVWVGFPLLLIIFSVGFVHLVSPQAIGSGIPEMKVILRGTVLRRYLSFQTFIAKTIGLVTAVSSGIPIGREGPFVHLACIVARLLSKFIKGFHGIYTNEARNIDMLACACGLGLSSSFAAPIGGVLFSIEVTTTYFAVRNYWRGFFTSVCGAFMFRLLAVLDSSEETITALFRTNFNIEFPFDVQEFFAFAFIGLTCGFGGALFVYTHRKIVYLKQRNESSKFTKFLTKSRFIYPAIIVIIVSTLTFPKGFGMFMAGQLTYQESIKELFSNITWTSGEMNLEKEYILSHWKTEHSNVFVNLVIFIIFKFIFSAICIALPVPAGSFIPVFIIGAAYGRLVGECMATWFPDGVRYPGQYAPIIPGGYAAVGAAAMVGAVTHTISTAVIVFEITGQFSHILPVMVAVLIANAVVQQLQPSLYDSMIEIKKLPYLPDIKGTRHYDVFAGDFMKRNVPFLSTKSTYLEIRELLRTFTQPSVALVDKPESMILLGSIGRLQLEWMLQRQFLSGQTRGDRAKDAATSPHHASVKFAAGEVSLNLPTDVPMSATKKKGTSHNNKVPVALQKLFSSNMSEMGESTIEDKTVGSNKLPQWELDLLNEPIDFTDCQIDPAPFQLVEEASLYKVHNLFSLLNLNYAYVTSIGRLVGMVTLDEMRSALENQKSYAQKHLNKLRKEGGHDDVQFDDTQSHSSIRTKRRAYTEPAPHSVGE